MIEGDWLNHCLTYLLISSYASVPSIFMWAMIRVWFEDPISMGMVAEHF